MYNDQRDVFFEFFFLSYIGCKCSLLYLWLWIKQSILFHVNPLPICAITYNEGSCKFFVGFMYLLLVYLHFLLYGIYGFLLFVSVCELLNIENSPFFVLLFT